MYIDTQEALETFIHACMGAPHLSVDTEFLREKTYVPLLCLVQMSTGSHEAVIDPFAPLDLRALVPLLTDTRTVKVFHAGEQDRAILYHEVGVAVAPVFDTQRATLLLGLPQQMSLAQLVRHFAKVTLGKEESFSDWAQRPLTKTQLAYALDDVHYLPAIYEQVVAALEERGRLSWLEEDFKAMEDERLYRVDEREIWRKLKGLAALKGRQLAVVREVAAWREGIAQARNLPRKWVLSDELLLEVAKREPSSFDALFKIRGLKERLGRRDGQQVLDAIETAHALPQDAWPVRQRPPGSDANLTAKLDLLGALVHHRAKELHIASSFLTSHDELAHLAAGRRSGLTILKGWRRELIGDELLQLLDGDIALSLAGENLKVTLLSQAGGVCAQ
ncbi:MAG: ribonuclease D [Coriobacteriales bacterium]|nr:ribonuclease D [Coriobacteriales bacterium]